MEPILNKFSDKKGNCGLIIFTTDVDEEGLGYGKIVFRTSKQIEASKLEEENDEFCKERMRKVKREGDASFDPFAFRSICRMWKGRNVDEMFEELISKHERFLMSARRRKTKLIDPGQSKSMARDSAEDFTHHFMKDLVGHVSVEIDSDILLLTDLFMTNEINGRSFEVVIDDRIEREFLSYLENNIIRAFNKIYETKVELEVLYSSSEKKAINIFKKCVGKSLIKEDDIEYKQDSVWVKTNSFPDADEVLNEGINNFTMLTLLRKCKTICEEALLKFPGSEVVVKSEFDERGMLRLLRSIESVKDRRLDEGKNDGILIALTVLEERTMKDNQNIKRMYVNDLSAIIESYSDVSTQKGKRIIKHLKKMVEEKKTDDNMDCLEMIGRIKGFCCELLICDALGQDMILSDSDRKIENLSVLQQDSGFVFSSAKSDRLLLTDIIMKKDSKYDAARLKDFLAECERMGRDKVMVKKSEGFENARSNVYIEVGCRMRVEEKSERDFTILKRCLSAEASFMSICFRKMTELIHLINNRDIRRNIEKVFDLKEDYDIGLEKGEYMKLHEGIKTIGQWSETALRSIMNQNWEKNVFEGAKDFLGVKKEGKITFLNCPYITKVKRNELIETINKEIMDNLGIKCHNQRSKILSAKLRIDERQDQSVRDIEDKIIKYSKLALSKILKKEEEEKSKTEKMNICRDINDKFGVVLNEMQEFARDVLVSGKQSILEDVCESKNGMSGKNTYFVKTNGECREDSWQILIGISEKEKEEGVQNRGLIFKKLKRMGNIDASELSIKSKQASEAMKESERNVLLTLCDQRPERRSVYDMTEPIVRNILLKTISDGLAFRVDSPENVVGKFLGLEKIYARDVFKRMTNLSESILVKGAKTSLVIALKRKDVYDLGRVCEVGDRKYKEKSDPKVKQSFKKPTKCGLTVLDMYSGSEYMQCFCTAVVMVDMLLQKGYKEGTPIFQRIKENGIEESIEEFSNMVVKKMNNMKKLFEKYGQEHKEENDKTEADFKGKFVNHEEVLFNKDEEERLKPIVDRTIHLKNRSSLLRMIGSKKDKIMVFVKRIFSEIKESLKEEEDDFLSSQQQIGQEKSVRRIVKMLTKCLFKIRSRIKSEKYTDLDDTEPCWLKDLTKEVVKANQESDMGRESFDGVISGMIKRSKKMMIRNYCVIENVKQISLILQQNKRTDLVEIIEDSVMPAVPKRYIVTDQEAIAEKICREKLVVVKDLDKRIEELGCSPEMKERMDVTKKESSKIKSVLFDFDYKRFEGDIDSYLDQEELEAVCDSLGFNMSDVGNKIKRSYEALINKLKKESFFSRSIFERAIGRALVRGKSCVSKKEPFLVNEVKGYNCFIVSRPLMESNVNYTFCIYDTMGNVCGPMTINEQKLNFFLSSPAIIVSNISSNVDDNNMSITKYTERMNSENSDERNKCEQEMKDIMKRVWKIDYLKSRVDMRLIVNTLSTCLKRGGALESVICRKIMLKCIKRIKEIKSFILSEIELNEEEEKSRVLSKAIEWICDGNDFTEEVCSHLDLLTEMLEGLSERTSIMSFLSLIVIKCMCEVYEKTKALKDGVKDSSSIFLTNFSNNTFRVMKENTGTTNEQMQKTRFVVLHKRGDAGAYYDFGKKLFTEGRKASVHMSRIQILWSVIYGCFSNSKNYMCSQSDLRESGNMTHLVTEMYFNQFYSKMLLSPIESTKEVTVKVFEKVNEWDNLLKKNICEGNDKCYCGHGDEKSLEKQKIINCLMCLDVYTQVAIEDEIVYCTISQHKFACSSPKMTKLLYSLLGVKNLSKIRKNLSIGTRLESNDLISMAKSTGMVEQIERTVDLSEVAKKVFWGKMKSVKGLVNQQKLFTVNESSKRTLKSVSDNLKKLNSFELKKDEKMIVEEEMKNVKGLRSKLKSFLTDKNKESEMEEVFKESCYGHFSQNIFKLMLTIKHETSRRHRKNHVLNVIENCLFPRVTFFRSNIWRSEKIKDSHEERYLLSEKSKDEVNKIQEFYSNILVSRQFRGLDVEDLSLIINEEEENKNLFPEQCDSITKERVVSFLKKSFQENNSISNKKQINKDDQSYSKKRERMTRDVEDGYHSEFLEMVTQLRAMDIGILRVMANETSPIKPVKVVLEDEKLNWNLGSDWDAEFDYNDLKFVNIGESFGNILKNCEKRISGLNVEVDWVGNLGAIDESGYDLILKNKKEGGNGRKSSFYVKVLSKTLYCDSNNTSMDKWEENDFKETFMSFFDTDKKQHKILDMREGCDVKRASELQSLLEDVEGSKRIDFNCDNFNFGKCVSCFSKGISGKDVSDLRKVKENCDSLCLKDDKNGWMIRNFESFFADCEFINRLQALYKRVEDLQVVIGGLTRKQQESLELIVRNDLSEIDEDWDVKKCVEEQKKCLEDLRNVFVTYTEVIDLFYTAGCFFSGRGLLRNGKVSPSVVPYSLDFDIGAKSFFRSKEMVDCFTLVCIRKKFGIKEMKDVLFTEDIEAVRGETKVLDLSKLLIRKNFLFTFYEASCRQSSNVKKLVKKRMSYDFKNAKKSTGAILIAERVYTLKKNDLVWNQMINILEDQKIMKHQTTIAPKNQLGAARDLKVQTLDSNIVQSSVEVVASEVFSCFENNTLTDKSCKKKFFKSLCAAQTNKDPKKDYIFFSKDGESWGPKMKGGHIIKGLADVCRLCGFEELSDVCDVIAEIWDNREAEVSGIVIEGIMKTFLNKRLDLSEGFEKLEEVLTDKTMKFIFKNLYEGKKTIQMPIHMGQGLLQSTSTGIQAALESCYQSILKRVFEEVDTFKMVAASDDSCEMICLTETDPERRNVLLKRICDLKQVISSALNVNDSSKSCVSRSIAEYHSVYICDGEEKPSKEKYTSGILMVGKDSNIKSFFESSYNLSRQLLNNSGDCFDLLQVLVGRMCSTLGTLNKKQKNSLLSCMSGTPEMGGIPPFEIMNWSVMRKEDFCNENRIFLCLRKFQKTGHLNRVEKGVLSSFFLEKQKNDFSGSSLFATKVDNKTSERLRDLSEMEPEMPMDDESRRICELLMTQNKVSDMRLDLLRMGQSLNSMVRSGSLRNENNLRILHIFHKMCSTNCVVIRNIQKGFLQYLPKGKSRNRREQKERRETCSVDDLLTAMSEFFTANSKEILECVRMEALNKRHDVMRLGRFLETVCFDEDQSYSRTLRKVDLFDGRKSSIKNTVLNTLVWHLNSNLMNTLGIKSLDELEIEDDFQRLCLIGKKDVDKCLELIESQKTVANMRKTDQEDKISILVNRIEGRTVGFSIYIGVELSSYHRAAEAFYETSSMKGERLILGSDSIPEFVENSSRGLIKEVIGFLCSVIDNAQDCRRLIQRTCGRELSKEQELNLRCKGSLMGSIMSSKNNSDQRFLKLYRTIIDSELTETFDEMDDTMSHNIFYFGNVQKTIFDFCLAKGAKCRFVMYDEATFIYGCRCSSEDFKRIIMKTFEEKFGCKSIEDVRRSMKRLIMLNCSNVHLRLSMDVDGNCYLGRDGIPFIEEHMESLKYREKGEIRRLVKHTLEKRKYGFVLHKKSVLVEDIEKLAKEGLTFLEGINTQIQKREKKEDHNSLNLIEDEMIEIPNIDVVEKKAIIFYGSKASSSDIINMCLTSINEDESSIIRLRKNYGDSFNKMYRFIKTDNMDKKEEKVVLTLRESFLSERFIESRKVEGSYQMEDEEGEMTIVYTKKGRIETLSNTSSFERTTKACDVLLNKLRRDAYVVESIKDNEKTPEIERAFSSISTDFIRNLMSLRDRSLSKLMAYIICFYDLETDEVFLMRNGSNYVKLKEEYFEKNSTFLFLREQKNIFNEISDGKKEVLVSKRLKKDYKSQERNYKEGLKNLGHSWAKLCRQNTGSGQDKMKTEEAFVVYEAKEDMNKYPTPEKKVKRSMEFCRECCKKVIDKFERIKKCLIEVFCLYKVNKFEESDLNKFISKCFNGELEIEKLEIEEPLWYKFGIYPEPKVGSTSIMTCKVMLKTGLGTNANKTIGWLLNNEKTINLFMDIVDYSREQRNVKKHLRRAVDRNESATKEKKVDEEISFLDWFNMGAKGDDNGVIDESILTSTNSTRSNLMSDSSTVTDESFDGDDDSDEFYDEEVDLAMWE